MATQPIRILNPTPAQVIVSGFPINPSAYWDLTIDDSTQVVTAGETTAPLWSWIAAGCVVMLPTADTTQIGYKLQYAQYELDG